MLKDEIIEKLDEKHRSFVELIQDLKESEFAFRPQEDKWSNGENLLHILKSTKPLSLALALPKLQLKLMFGKANRPSRSFDELVEKYKEKLVKGGKANGKFVPSEIHFEERDEVINKLIRTVSRVCKKLESYSEKNLDQLILPHPLLGKLTVREMMYFTIYHVQHHQQIVERNLATDK